MTTAAIQAASWLSPAGYGNELTGLRPWPTEIEQAIRAGNPEAAHWSVLFSSDPARFGRMDLMSRLGLMAIELLNAGLAEMPQTTRDRVGVLVETTAGSLATDLKFLQTPRASLFTYTLPSTVIGEICIRYRLRGPLLCLIGGSRREEAQAVAAPGALGEAVHWLQTGEAEACVCLRCDALDRESVATLETPALWPHPQWEACALLLGRSTGTSREHIVLEPTIRANCARLCKVPSE